MRNSRRRSRVAALGATAVASITLALGATSIVGAFTPPNPDQIIDKVTICHRTNSNNNPYIVNTPDADGDVSGHADHTGPVWNITLKPDHIKWGDIIPPFKFAEGEGGTFPGLNWTDGPDGGKAWYANDCQAPVEPPVIESGDLVIAKTVSLPSGTPLTPIPSSFSVHVVCDDEFTDTTVTVSPNNPATLTDIDEGTECTITEDKTGLDPATVVTYSPSNVVTIVKDTSVTVTVNNNFAGVPVQVAAESLAATPIVAAAPFAG